MKQKQMKMHPMGPYHDSSDPNYFKDEERSFSQQNSMSHLINQTNSMTQFSKIEAQTVDGEAKRV